ncbi:MAG: GxxExxY protein [Alphaproteobacteria bacterium]|nr:MAG: GxxExxY protein [Alphaproteobacteria bacterium]
MMDSPQRTRSSAELNQLSQRVLDAAYRVHSALGPGLLESAYEHCLAYELGKQGVAVARQVSIPIVYDGLEIDEGFRIDLLVENRLIVEIKAVDALMPIHQAQLLTYLKLANKQIGLLINFKVQSLKHGIKRMVHNL